MENTLIFILQGFEQQSPDGTLMDSVTVELLGKKYDEVLKRAQKIVEKKFWRLQSVIEKENAKNTQ